MNVASRILKFIKTCKKKTTTKIVSRHQQKSGKRGDNLMQKYYKVKTDAVFHLSGEIVIPSLKRIFYTNCFVLLQQDD